MALGNSSPTQLSNLQYGDNNMGVPYKVVRITEMCLTYLEYLKRTIKCQVLSLSNDESKVGSCNNFWKQPLGLQLMSQPFSQNSSPRGFYCACKHSCKHFISPFSLAIKPAQIVLKNNTDSLCSRAIFFSKICKPNLLLVYLSELIFYCYLSELTLYCSTLHLFPFHENLIWIWG